MLTDESFTKFFAKYLFKFHTGSMLTLQKLQNFTQKIKFFQPKLSRGAKCKNIQPATKRKLINFFQTFKY